MTAAPSFEGLLRGLAPQVLGTLVRRHGQFDLCEDAVQESLLAATLQWPAQGVPDRPRAWLLTVAERAPSIGGGRTAPGGTGRRRPRSTRPAGRRRTTPATTP